jgi:prohibitin 2
MTPQALQKLIGVGLIVFVLVIFGSQSTYVVEPGSRGVRVTLGKVSELFVPEGLTFKLPLITEIHQVSIKQQTQQLEEECYTSDLQQVTTELRVLYSIPEGSVVELFRAFQSDDPRIQTYFKSLIRPRVVEALKEALATESAELIVQKRETIKNRTVEGTRLKLGLTNESNALISIVDIALQGIQLSPELTKAIEQKMTQEQEAEKAKFVQQQTEIEAETAVIKAEGEAEAIRIRGEALRQNPSFIDLEIVEKWDGQSPIVVTGGRDEDSVQIMVPVNAVN